MNKTNAMIMAIIMMILLSATNVYAATVQPKVQETAAVETTEVTVNANTDVAAGKATKAYPKSMQRIVLESVEAGQESGKAEVKRIQNQIVTVKENTVAVESRQRPECGEGQSYIWQNSV